MGAYPDYIVLSPTHFEVILALNEFWDRQARTIWYLFLKQKVNSSKS